jgi:phenylpropionate dioxygenase-like ring-hydroxylating dioxygenase large terminal subunit
MPFVLNAWYVVAWPHEVPPNTILARTVCNNAMIVWRGPDGAVHALEDRCPHREMPLSLGILEGDHVRCRYHGLRFAPDGRCVEVPGQDRIAATLAVHRYPTVEKYGWIWVWPGASEKADPALVPAMYAHNDDPALIMEGATAHIKANYLLMVDNLLDLTHEPYIHPTTLGNAAVFESAPETVVDGDSVTVTRWMLNKTPSPYWVAMLKHQTGYEGPCDRWQRIFFTPPSSISLDIGVAAAGTGAPQGDRSQGIAQVNNHSITPETESSLFNFWSVGCTFYDRKRAREVADIVADTIIKEDQLALEGVQSVIDRQPGRPYYSIPTDKPGLAARRIVERILAAEKPARSKAV